MGKKLFVTCGATVPFPQLVECIVSKQFTELAANQFNYTEFVIQYGIGYTESFEKLIHDIYGAEPIPVEDTCKYGCPRVGRYRLLDGKLLIHGLEYSSKIQELIQDSALVVSHAGTGSILDALRSEGGKAGKPLIVVVNDTLMDNHQEQIASRFESMGYIVSCHSSLGQLTLALASLEDGSQSLKPFPQAHNDGFARLLLETSLH